MKHILFAAVAFAMIISCATPKYNYYFDRYSASSSPSVKASRVDLTKSWSKGASKTVTFSSPLSIQAETLVANTSKENISLPYKIVLSVNNSPQTSMQELTRAKKGLLKEVKEFRLIKKHLFNPQKNETKVKMDLLLLGLF